MPASRVILKTDVGMFRLVNGEEAKETDNCAEFEEWIAELVFMNHAISFRTSLIRQYPGTDSERWMCRCVVI
jgi:hypothetical protein